MLRASHRKYSGEFGTALILAPSAHCAGRLDAFRRLIYGIAHPGSPLELRDCGPFGSRSVTRVVLAGRS
jgi:hypothetical protein